MYFFNRKMSQLGPTSLLIVSGPCAGQQPLPYKVGRALTSFGPCFSLSFFALTLEA
jgi:hypothetical protein